MHWDIYSTFSFFLFRLATGSLKLPTCLRAMVFHLTLSSWQFSGIYPAPFQLHFKHGSTCWKISFVAKLDACRNDFCVHSPCSECLAFMVATSFFLDLLVNCFFCLIYCLPVIPSDNSKQILSESSSFWLFMICRFFIQFFNVFIFSISVFEINDNLSSCYCNHDSSTFHDLV